MLRPMLNVVYFCISTSQSMCLVPTVAVFRSFFMLHIPCMLFRRFLNDFEIVPVDCFDCHHPCLPLFLSALVERLGGGERLNFGMSFVMVTVDRVKGLWILLLVSFRPKIKGVWSMMLCLLVIW